MSEKPLLLSSAKSGVVVTRSEHSHWLRRSAIAFGVIAVLIGAADAAARLSHSVFGDQASFMTFAPAAAIIDPSLMQSVTHAELAPATTTSSSFVPTHLDVPSIGVHATVESVGQNADGSMGTPTTFDRVAWYKLGSKPGQAGNAVIDGHVNNALTTAGVFEHLAQVKIGDEIEVSDTTGHSRTYHVAEIQDYPPDMAPTQEIFSTTGPSQLVLITCDGDWDAAKHQFNERLVVVAR